MFDEYIRDYNDMSYDDADIAQHFGRHALSRLNAYSCFLEDLVLENITLDKLRTLNQYLNNVHNNFYPTNNIRPFVRTIAH